MRFKSSIGRNVIFNWMKPFLFKSAHQQTRDIFAILSPGLSTTTTVNTTNEMRTAARKGILSKLVLKRHFATDKQSLMERSFEAYDDHFLNRKHLDRDADHFHMKLLLEFSRILRELSNDLDPVECWISHRWSDEQNIATRNLGMYLEMCGYKIFSDQKEKQSALIEDFMRSFGYVHSKKVVLAFCIPDYVERVNRPDGYELVFASPGVKHEKDKLYIECLGSSLKYTVINPKGVVVEDFIHVDYLPQPLRGKISATTNIDSIKPFLFEILMITSLKGHTRDIPGAKKEFYFMQAWLDNHNHKDRVIPLLLHNDANTSIPGKLLASKRIDIHRDTDQFMAILNLIKRIQSNFGTRAEQKINQAITNFETIVSQAKNEFNITKHNGNVLYSEKALDDQFLSTAAYGIGIKLSTPLREENKNKMIIKYQGLMPRYKHFVGREEDISILENLVASKKICLLCDTDGEAKSGGKTFLANEFSYRGLEKRHFNDVYWFDAKNLSSINKSIRQLLSLPLKTDSCHMDDINIFDDFIRAYFSDPERSNNKLLLVYDNVEDVNLLEQGKFLENRNNVHSLLISNKVKSQIPSKYDTHNIISDKNWTNKFLIKKFPTLQHNNELLDKFSDLTSKIPLIVYQLASFIEAMRDLNNIDMSRMIELIKLVLKEFSKIKSDVKKLDLNLSEIDLLSLVNYSFVLNFYKKDQFSLGKTNFRQGGSRNQYQLMADILNFCSLIGRERIPKKLITNWLGQRNGKTNGMIELLIKFKLLDVDRADDQNFFVIYPATQSAILRKLMHTGRKHYSHLLYVEGWISIVIRVLLENIEKVPDTELLYHADSLIKNIYEFEDERNSGIRRDDIDLYNFVLLKSYVAEKLPAVMSENPLQLMRYRNDSKRASIKLCDSVNNFWKAGAKYDPSQHTDADRDIFPCPRHQ